MSHLHNKKEQVPSWSAFNEAISTDNSEITTPGMLPILQAPADDADTVATISNTFMETTTHLGQSYTIVVMDQPLYCKAKELPRVNND